MDWLVRHGAVVMVFLGGLIAAIGAFAAERRASARHAETQKRIWSIVILVGALIGGAGTYWAGYQQDQISAYLSGSDSYGYLTLGPQTGTSIQFIFQQVGDAPFYDVMLDVHDATKFKELWLKKGFPPEALDPNSKWQGSVPTSDGMELQRQTLTAIPVGNLGPGQARIVWTAPVPESEEQHYSISIFARNGLIVQDLLLHRTGEGWAWATKVWRTSIQVKNGKQDRQALYEMVTPSFPRDRIHWQ